MNYTISIIAKPYIKRFIQNTYGDPANINSSPILREKLISSLTKPCYKYDNTRYDKQIFGYTETIEIIITNDQFYRYGWELSNTDMIAFNKLAEHEIKLVMRNFISTCLYLPNMQIKDAIELFQKQFNFTDEDWSFSAIQKDFYRNGYHPKNNYSSILKDTVNQIVTNLFMVNLSSTMDRLTLTKKIHENTIQKQVG